jgi:diacylglycerol kinase family enzyme
VLPLRALLLFNPNATTTDDHVRDVIASALASEIDLDVQPTKQRGHATHIVAGAVHEGVDVVFALGGDGTANEVIQALAGTGVRFGHIPGGGANVFARALGLPNDPVQATAVMLDRLRSRTSRSIGLGRANGRYFGFNAGFGFDAAVVRLVEQNAAMKRRFRQAAFVALALREWFGNEDRQDPPVSIEFEDEGPRGAYGICIVGNTDPYTYLGPRPLHVTPHASFDTGLDLLAIREVSTGALLRILAGVFREGSHLGHRQVEEHHDLARFTLVSPRPQPLMVDGDYAGEHDRVLFEAVPDALRVLA